CARMKLKTSTAVSLLIASVVVLAIACGFVLLTQVQASHAPELPRFREKLTFLRSIFSESHPEVQRQVKMVAELERNPSSLLGRWVQTNKPVVWEFRDDGSVSISRANAGITKGTYRSVTSNLIRLNFGSTNTHTGFIYTKVADGQLTFID